MTIPKGIDYGFTITVVEKDSFLPQDLENMDEVNSSFKLCSLDGLCDVTTGTATMTRQGDEVDVYTETTNVITKDYLVGEYINQTTSGLYYQCIKSDGLAAKKYLTDLEYFAEDLNSKFEEAGTIVTRGYTPGVIVKDTVGSAWYKCLNSVEASKLLTDSKYFTLVAAYEEVSNTITDDYVVNNVVKQATSGLWYRCTANVSVVSLTNLSYFATTTTYEEAAATTVGAYVVNDYIQNTGTGVWYRCIANSTAGTLLSNLSFFEEVTLKTEDNHITSSAYAIHDLIQNTTFNTFYRCVNSVGASPLLTDLAYFTAFTLNTEISNTITGDYALSDIVYNSTTNYYFRCTTAVTAVELLTNANNFEVLVVNVENSTDASIVNNYLVGEYGYSQAYDTLYKCVVTLSATGLLTDTEYFSTILAGDIDTYLDGRIKVELDAIMTGSLNYLRGDAVDGYYLKPTYQGVINIKFTDATPERTAIVEKVYVAPTGVICV